MRVTDKATLGVMDFRPETVQQIRSLLQSLSGTLSDAQRSDVLRLFKQAYSTKYDQCSVCDKVYEQNIMHLRNYLDSVDGQEAI